MLELECWSVGVGFSTVERALKTRIFCDQKFFKKRGRLRAAGALQAGPRRPRRAWPQGRGHMAVFFSLLFLLFFYFIFVLFFLLNLNLAFFFSFFLFCYLVVGN